VIRALVVDDHPVVRHGIKQILSEAEDVESIDEAGTAQEAFASVNKAEYDVVLMDIALPGMNGIEALKQIRKLRAELPVLVLSVYDEDVYALRAIEAGAAGYVMKSSASAELLEAVRTVCAGHKYIRPSLGEKLATALHTGVGVKPHEELSDREYEILLLIASGKTVSEIASQLSLSPKTVSTYRVRALEKMGLKTNAELMRYAIENGLVK